MDNKKIISALQDLIIRLQDAEKGYMEISRASSNTALNSWLEQYAKERHNMHKALEAQVSKLGGDADVKTSFLGDLHRMFIDIKINKFDDDFESIYNEIERGSNVLLNDYKRVLSEITLPPQIVSMLQSQKVTIELEVEALKKLNEELNAVEA